MPHWAVFIRALARVFLTCWSTVSEIASKIAPQTAAGQAIWPEKMVATGESWNAVLNRDRNYDGKFVYAAVTTGVYCRPSCPARHPHRRNTLLFSTPEDAEKEGFVPCSRCSPATNSLTLAEKCIEAVLNYIEARYNQAVTLKTLSQITGLSANHLHQTFNRIVGLSPKTYCDARRIEHLRRSLRNGNSISSAIYAAGYGSSRALYEKSKNSLGMTPSAYQRGGEGMQIHYAGANCALGRVGIAATNYGLCATAFGTKEKLLIATLRSEFPKAILILDKVPRPEWIPAISACMTEDPLLSKLPTATRVRVFQAKVFSAFQ
jgi:AraC family transcriptional regulator, regulatory protein of adaptative response / methylated-DNA-[protein]-cysteine methyltransferase